MSDTPSPVQGTDTSLREGNFWCPICEEEQYPDEVGTIKCEACGGTVETYATDAEVREAERV